MVDTSTGKSIPAYVSISPNFAKIIVDGTAVTVLLNISEKTIILKTNLLPGNGIMASEYAQSDASIICPAAPVTVRKTVLKTYRENGIAVSLNKLNIVTKFESVGFCTKILGGKRKSSKKTPLEQRGIERNRGNAVSDGFGIFVAAEDKEHSASLRWLTFFGRMPTRYNRRTAP